MASMGLLQIVPIRPDHLLPLFAKPPFTTCILSIPCKLPSALSSYPHPLSACGLFEIPFPAPGSEPLQATLHIGCSLALEFVRNSE
jgi:hypothetical protein